MSYVKRFKGLLAAAIVLVGAAIYAVGPVLPVAAQSAALSIVPRKNYQVAAGDSVSDTLIIRNMDQEQSLDLTLRIVDFTFNDDTGTPQLMLDSNAAQTTWSMKPFLTVPESVSIPAGDSATLDIGVNIPANQGAGSFYSAIVYSSGASDGGNVGLNASGVTLVFNNVPGEVDEKLTLDNFGAYNRPTASSEGGYGWLFTSMPQTMAYTVKNDGNVTEAPVGSITLRHMFGRETVIDDVNPNNSLALIGQSRTFIACITLEKSETEFAGSTSRVAECGDAGLWPGFYSASLDLYYGQNGNQTQEVTGVGSFWYLPWWFIIAFFAVLAAIAAFVLRIVYKVRNRRFGQGNRIKRASRRK